MKFTSYYSTLIKSKGFPHLSVRQQQVIMNIVYLEGGLLQLDQFICNGEANANKLKAIFKLEGQLKKLTKNQTPDLFFQELLSFTD